MLSEIRKEVVELIGPGVVPRTHTSLGYTPRAKRALSLAASEAKAMNHQRVGSGAIFLGLVLEGEGLAGVALKKLGVNLETSRKQILKELGR
jgi:ATP-dependent Clp protease ATP-binding subunit ClpC